MSIPPVLRSLLTAHGPSGYETAPAAVFRDAASAFAEVVTDVMGSVWARVPGNAGGATHVSRGGTPCGGVGLPLRYMHSPVEMVQLDDIENSAKLIAAVAHRLTA